MAIRTLSDLVPLQPVNTENERIMANISEMALFVVFTGNLL